MRAMATPPMTANASVPSWKLRSISRRTTASTSSRRRLIASPGVCGRAWPAACPRVRSITFLRSSEVSANSVRKNSGRSTNTITARAKAMPISAAHSIQGPNTIGRSPLNSSSSTRATSPII